MQTDRAPDMTIVREFDAPRELLFAIWTQAEHMKKWWGPAHFTTPVVESDAREGGALYIVMQGPEGTKYPMTGAYETFDPPARLVMIAEPEGDAFRVRNLVNFDAKNGKTRVTINAWILHSTPEAAEPLSGMKDGWDQQLDKLAAYVAETTLRGG